MIKYCLRTAIWNKNTCRNGVNVAQCWAGQNMRTYL
uniref:Uncharacterized protein n=1 Tax=Anguilla anguilla TaxID=7936 RepID=A0A0E9S5F4_ANGAN